MVVALSIAVFFVGFASASIALTVALVFGHAKGGEDERAKISYAFKSTGAKIAYPETPAAQKQKEKK